MARPDCSEWAKTITQIAMNIASRQGAGADLDSVVKGMQPHVPEITRDAVAQAIVEATEQDGRNEDEIANVVNAVKQEARTDRLLNRQINRLEKNLEAGQVPVELKRATKRAAEAIQRLRAIRDTLKKQLAASEPAQKKRLQKQIDKMDAIIEKGDFTPRVKPPPVAQSKELERLEFQRDEKRRFINQKIRNLKPQNVWVSRFDKLNAGRAIMTSLDESAVLRQGGFFVFSNPKLAAKSLGPMFRATMSRQNEAKVEKEIEGRDNFIWYSKTKLATAGRGSGLTQKEEAYQTTWAEKIPVLGPLIKASERGYQTFLFKLRADAFDTFAATLTKDGDLNLEQAQAITNFVNVATGRGSIKGFEKSALALNALFFSPRLMASRFQMLAGTIAPGAVFKAPKEVRKVIRRQYAKYLIGIGLMYAMASLAFEDDDEFDIEFDPRSSDFGKLRFGNTRVDPLSGMSQTIVLLTRIAKGEFKSAATGNIRKIRGTELGFGKGDGFEVTTQFLRNKFSPLMGTFVDVVLRGKTFEGEKPTVWNVAGGYLPMTFEEVKESIQEQGLTRGSAISLMAIFGMGVQTWGHAFETMDNTELRRELKKHTYKKSGTVSRDGKSIFVSVGEAHAGEEGRVKAIKAELQKRR